MAHPRTPDELDRYRWLIGDEGRALLDKIAALATAATPTLRIAERLRARYPADLVALAMTQHELRRHARAKFHHPERLFLTREGLEQATSARIAAHRARRFEGRRHVADLCTGIGGDLMALAGVPGVERLTAVDLDPVHLLLAAANAGAVRPGPAIEAVVADVRDVDVRAAEAIFIDPARRNAHVRLGLTSEPPLEWVIRLAERVPRVGIKTAPGVPHEMVPAGWELETIALGPELKEAVLWSPALATGPRTATVIDGDIATQLRPEPGDTPAIRTPESGDWLLDPNPAVTRAGLVADLARVVHADMLDPAIGFLVATAPVETPLARAWPVHASLAWHEKRVKAALRDLDAGPVDVRRRGLAGDVDAITRRLRGKGSRRVLVAMTRVNGEPWAIVCDATTR